MPNRRSELALKSTLGTAVALGLFASSCTTAPPPTVSEPSAAPGAAGDPAAQGSTDPQLEAQAKAFVASVDAKLRELVVKAARAEWAKATNITPETEAAAAKANAELMGYESQAVKEAARFAAYEGDADVARQIQLLRVSTTLPAPADEAKRNELALIAAKMEGAYGKGKYCK
jgi:peptidyl-dipeptidase A